MISNNDNADYGNLVIYITENLYEVFKHSIMVFTKQYKNADKLLKEVKPKFCSFLNEEVYSLSYKLLMEFDNEDNILKIENRVSKINKNILKF